MASRVMYYLRVRVDEPDEDNVGADSVEVRAPFPDLEMTFVDLCSRNRSTNPPRTAELETLSEAVQNQLHRCSQTDTILFRWPWLVQRDDESHRQQIRNWLSRLTENSGGEPVISGSSNVGVGKLRNSGFSNPSDASGFSPSLIGQWGSDFGLDTHTDLDVATCVG